ncbi:MAG: hypothetical protein UZ14_CFX002000060 [Chloroflexi bacterium OLB14]|nr:MAG: hypothetical protein UZ14_CFX002000060 [Chloroflexi bacterium OLB14]
MVKKLPEATKLLIIGNLSNDFEPLLDKNLLHNEMMMQKINEERQLALIALQDYDLKVSELHETNWELKLENQKLKLELRAEKQKRKLDIEEISRESTISFFFSIVTTILIGFGINLITSGIYILVGWIMVFVAILVEIILIFSRLKRKSNNYES